MLIFAVVCIASEFFTILYHNIYCKWNIFKYHIKFHKTDANSASQYGITDFFFFWRSHLNNSDSVSKNEYLNASVLGQIFWIKSSSNNENFFNKSWTTGGTVVDLLSFQICHDKCPICCILMREELILTLKVAEEWPWVNCCIKTWLWFSMYTFDASLVAPPKVLTS